MAMLAAILALYVSPARQWLRQSHTAAGDRAELRALERQNGQLRERIHRLRQPRTLEREARRLGMVRKGERAFVIENLRP
jgi:cell division protein FtsB